jgi:hypothetical protein
VKFQSFSHYVLALLAALLVASCGGGGAAHDPNQGGTVTIAPETGTFYAGLPATITVSGGRTPYSLTSSDPGILPVPAILNGHRVDVVPNQPGVVDAGIQAGELPVRTVIITARDSTGVTVTAAIKVAQNFLTSYGLFFGFSTCQGASPCSGGETTLHFFATFGGTLHGNEPFRLEHVRGPWQFVDPIGSNNLSDVFLTASDHEGKVTAVIRVAAGTPTQVGIIRVVHVNTGASTEFSFTINGTPATATLTLIPEEIVLTGANDTQCGTGAADFLVFDGQAPFSATCLDASLVITPTSTTNPGRFTVNATNPNVCLDKSPCVVTDATGAHATMPVTTKKGPAPPAPPDMTIAPSSLTLACGASGTITVVGGNGPPYAASSSHPRVTATVVSASQVTITRLTGDPLVPATQQTTATVSITDGATIKTVDVTIIPDDPATGKCF